MVWPVSWTVVENVTLGSLGAQTNAGERREGCHATTALIAALRGTGSAALNNWGQVRVVRGNRQALLTITGQLSGVTGNVLRVWTGANSGASKIFGQDTVPSSPGTCTVIVPPASRATLDDLGIVSTGEHAGTIDTGDVGQTGSTFFREAAAVRADSRVLLVLSHGGDVDVRTSTQRAPFVTGLSDCQIADPASWECVGRYDGANTFQQWHITNMETRRESFPLLDELLDLQAPHLPEVPVQYAVSFHGFANDTQRVAIIGGRITQAEKIVLRDAIQAELDALDPVPEVTLCVALATPASDAVTWLAPNAACANDHAGVHRQNLVNRLSPNDDVVAFRGGIQLEQSRMLRDDATALAAVSRGVGRGVCQLLAAAPHVYIRDRLDDVGDPHDLTGLWLSPDLCVRATRGAPGLVSKSSQLTCEELTQGQPAWAYVRAYNRNPTPAENVFAHLYESAPATIVSPALWQPVGVASLGPVASNSVPARAEISFTPQFSGHRCLVAILADRQYSLPALRTIAAAWPLTQFGRFVRTNPRAAWHNFQVATAGTAPSPQGIDWGFTVIGWSEDAEFVLEVASDLAEGRVVLTLPEALFFGIEAALDPAIEAVRQEGAVRLEVPAGGAYTLGKGTLPAKAAFPCTLRFDLDAWPAKAATAWVRQTFRGEEVGRVTFQAAPEEAKAG